MDWFSITDQKHAVTLELAFGEDGEATAGWLDAAGTPISEAKVGAVAAPDMATALPGAVSEWTSFANLEMSDQSPWLDTGVPLPDTFASAEMASAPEMPATAGLEGLIDQTFPLDGSAGSYGGEERSAPAVIGSEAKIDGGSSVLGDGAGAETVIEPNIVMFEFLV